MCVLLKQSATIVTVIIKWLLSMEVVWEPRSMGPSVKSSFFVQVEEHNRQTKTNG